MSRFPAAVLIGAALSAGGMPSAAAEPLCREVRVAFQPDCYRANLQAPCNPRKSGSQLDLGPQIAVWLADANGGYVDTIMVTSLVGTRGLGNRPGRWDFQSAPRFPYGRRPQSLPIWAFSRGQLYDLVVFQDGRESWLGFHESVSSPDPYYCRPMSLSEVDVDAITCPTAVFSSAKGRFEPQQKSPYPPRNDLVSFTDRDCDEAYAPDPKTCTRSAELFAKRNELDAVSRATPPFGRTYEVRRVLPDALTAGPYFVRVEISKEFDQNDDHRHRAYQDPQLPESGIETSIGQPSVLFEVPIALGANSTYGNTTNFIGYGDWDGHSGRVHAPDASISSTPGSGEGRLLPVPSPWGMQAVARVHVMTSGCGGTSGPGGPGAAGSCEAPAAASDLALRMIGPTSATFAFTHAAQPTVPVAEYDIRYREGTTLTADDFLQGSPAPAPEPGAPGTEGIIELASLKPLTRYVLGVRARAQCGQDGPLVTVPFETKQVVYAQLSGCFVATAALGSALAPELQPLRRLRDEVSTSGRVGEALVESYYRASPPLADAVADLELARVMARVALTPLFALGRALTKPQSYVGGEPGWR